MLSDLANQARTRTKIYEAQRQFLFSLKIPFLVTLHDTQRYVPARLAVCAITTRPARFI